MKTHLFAVLSVSFLMLASASPVALAQDATANKDKAARGADVQYVDCSQVASAIQNQYGDAAAPGDFAVAEVANEQGITINQVNACLGNVDRNGDGDRDDKNGGEDGNKNTKDDSVEDRDDDVLASTVPKVASLPNTGGPSLLALGAGLALVACGTLMHFRR